MDLLVELPEKIGRAEEEAGFIEENSGNTLTTREQETGLGRQETTREKRRGGIGAEPSATHCRKIKIILKRLPEPEKVDTEAGQIFSVLLYIHFSVGKTATATNRRT